MHFSLGGRAFPFVDLVQLPSSTSHWMLGSHPSSSSYMEGRLICRVLKKKARMISLMEIYIT